MPSFPTLLHYFLHFGFPLLLALTFFRPDWRRAYLILLATMLVDADHLLADPIFQANRCSIGFHYLHSFYVIPVYFVLMFFRKPYHLIGIGLTLHMATDLVDCLLMFQRCRACHAGAPAFELLETILE